MNDRNKAKWGILGTANIAKKALVPGIRDAKSSELYAVGSRDAGRAEQFGAEFDIPKSYGSYEELLDDPRVEFLYIPLPNHLHHKWSIEAVKQGKHVLCEKPLAVNTEEVREMFAAAEENDVKLMEGFMYRFHPQVQRVKELIERGEIGEPKFFRGAFSFPMVAQDREDDIRWKEEMGGGSVMDLGTYSINTVRFLFGEDPSRVFARSAYHPDHTAEAETQAIMEFPDGKTATFDSSFLLSDRANYEVASDSGSIRAFNTYGPGRGKRVNIEVIRGDSREQETLGPVNEYALEVDELVNAAHEDCQPLITPEDSVNNARVLDAIGKSAEKEAWVKI
jgi:predicted dehydrogenase